MKQLSLFEETPRERGPHGETRVGDALAAGGAVAFVSVLVDIPTRSLAEPFAYAVPAGLADACTVGCTVLVGFGRRPALGYVVALADALADLPGTEGLDPARVKPVRRVLAEPAFTAPAARVALWMSREYVAPVADCIRLFLPPGASPRLVRRRDGSYDVERPAVTGVSERWVSLTEEGRSFEPPARATRQRQLVEALACGPVTTRDLNLLYTNMSQTVRALERRGIVAVEERRAWRGTADSTTLSSADGSAPEHLTRGQEEALEQIRGAVDGGADDVVLVDGVTGSGKTEVYLAAIERVLERGGSACVLVPEISLTAQTVGRFRSRFGGRVAVFHSRLSAGERLDQWDLVRTGAARVVVGARSALFCPYRDLGIIIIDEEHETSYKQGSSPRYHAREVACAMGRELGCPVVLGSATPSAEALERCARGSHLGQRWVRVEMPERPAGSRLPEVVVADLRREFARGSRSIFSRQLADALMGVADRREKAVLLHNRRGFAPFLMCRECGCVPTCEHCSTALTYHERTHTLECHTCGRSYPVRAHPAPGSRCPRCGSPYLAKMGLGTQQVEDALRALLPDHVEVIRMDADSTRGKDGHKKLLERFDAAECAVLLGTQMIAKGLDFPEVTLAGVIMADYSLKMPDFRAQERSFDLLEQLAGRAGRGADAGRMVIQTYLPGDPVIRAVAAHDRSIFFEHDARQRREAGYPPYVRLANVVCWSASSSDASGYAAALARALRDVIAEGAAAAGAGDLPGAGDVPGREGGGEAPSLAGDALAEPVVLGPAPCVIERAKDRYRFHVMLKCPVGYHISDTLAEALGRVATPRGVSLSVDVDAYDFM